MLQLAWNLLKFNCVTSEVLIETGTVSLLHRKFFDVHRSRKNWNFKFCEREFETLMKIVDIFRIQ